MTRNNLIFKILFAIELALVPMVIFAQLLLDKSPWVFSIFMAGILLAQIWLHLFNDKTKASVVILSIGNILVYCVLLIFFMVTKQINIPLGIIAAVIVLFANIFKISLYNKAFVETIEAVDYCYTLFEILTVAAFAILGFYSLISNIGLFAIILTGVISVAYKVYYTVKYTDFIAKLKKLFKRN